MTQEKKTFQPATSNGVCAIYELLHKRGFVSFPPTRESREKVDAIVPSIIGTYFGVDNYPTAQLKAVAYLYFIIKDHPFTDGNKRTAVITFETVCALNGLVPDYGDFSLDSLAVYLEKTQEKDHQKIIALVAALLFPEGEAGVRYGK